MSTKNFAAFSILLLASACTGTLDERTRFHVKEGQFMRGDRPYSLYAVSASDSLLREWDASAAVLFLNRVCASGGNGIVVDLESLKDEGGTGIGDSWARNFLELVSAARWREMAIVLRVFPPGTSLDAGWRRAIIDDLASRLKGRWDLLYWVEDDEPGQMARYFKRKARGLATLGPFECDLRAGDGVGGRPSILVWSIPAPVTNYTGFILPAGDHSLGILEGLFEISRGEPAFRSEGLLDEDEIEEGFVPLFDGVSLSGWVVTGEPAGWTVKDGRIDWVQRGGRYLRTVERYRDFVLRLEWKIGAEGNSGVFIHAPLNGRWSRIGKEIQLLGDYGKPPHKNGTGSVYDVVAPSSNASRPVGEWNSMEVVSDGPNLRVTLNGAVVQDLQVDQDEVLRLRLKEGFIAFQDHGNPVSFRKVRIRRL